MNIEINKLTKKYDEKYVLQSLTFSFQNEIIGLLGQSGAGKTTLLKILAGLETFDSGTILIDDKSILESKNNVGILLQDQELINHLNVFNNISFMIEKIPTTISNPNLKKNILDEIKIIKENKLVYSFKLNRKEKQKLFLSIVDKYDVTLYSLNLFIKSKGDMSLIRKKIEKLNNKVKNKKERCLTKYEIEKEVISVSKITLSSQLLFKKPYELSLGENNRVRLAIALIKRPSILLLDEPTGNLDPILKKEILQNIHNVYSKLKIPIIYVTHSFEEASNICSKLLFLNHGQIDQFDEVDNIKKNPKASLVKSYIDNDLDFIKSN